MNFSVEQEINEFFKKYKKQNFKKGEMLIRADDEPSGVFLLSKGNVKMYALNANGDEQTLTVFKEGSFFPMSWVLAELKNRYFFEAATECEVYKAPKLAVVELLNSNPKVALDLLRRVFVGMDGLLMRMEHMMSGHAYAKLLTELIIQAKRFGSKDSANSYEIKITEKELSSRAGLTRETVSREIKILKEQGLIAFSKSTLVIPDLKMLEIRLLES